MLETVIGKKESPVQANELQASLLAAGIDDGTLYFGYPIVALAADFATVHAVLTHPNLGVVIFDFTQSTTEQDVSEALERRKKMILAFKSKLLRHEDLTTDDEDLAVPVSFVFFVPEGDAIRRTGRQAVRSADGDSLPGLLQQLTQMEPGRYRSLNAAIQHVSTMKPRKKRRNVQRGDSRGGALKELEKGIANLDAWQKKGAIETVDGPQRIRGLAGSGKTIVLALKAAYLHAQNPEWDIAVTFYTRSLRNTLKELIRRFSYEHTADEPNFEKLRVMQSWGGYSSAGLYSSIAIESGNSPMSFREASSRFGRRQAFDGACEELVDALENQEAPGLFDAILVDEAQDFHPSFFRLCQQALRDPKRLVWAYDELQSLTELTMPPLAELFGTTEEGQPRVSLSNEEGAPQQDVILHRCYRNTPWCLSAAHALGFGIYRDDGLIQAFDDNTLWEDIGYELEDGTFAVGEEVVLRRAPDSNPAFFEEHIAPEDAVSFVPFNSSDHMFEEVCKSIAANLQEDELDPSDIMVVFPDPFQAQKRATALHNELGKAGIRSHVAGVTTTADEFFVEGSVAIASILRAKGNEAPFVCNRPSESG